MTNTDTRGRFSRLGTAAIAYLSLAVGAGLSTAFNVVHTIETRGALLDGWDIVVAVAGPGMVVLMVELFVSTLWAGQRWYMQAIRWLGCVMVAAIAMRMSWTHGHDFLASRGQTGDVSALMPLAVDTLAIMATALLLSSRTRARVWDASWAGAPASAPIVSLNVPPQDMDTEPMDMRDTNEDTMSGSLDHVDTAEDIMSALSARLGHLDSTPAVPVVPGDIAPVSPAGPDALDLDIVSMLSIGPLSAGDKRALADKHGVTTKTVGRRESRLRGQADTDAS